MIKIKTYYIKQGKIKLFKKINIRERKCEILKRLESEEKINKVIEQMKINRIGTVILSKELYQNVEFIRALNNNRIIVLDGKWLYRYMMPDIVEYICKKANIDDNVEVGMLTNEVTDEFLGNLEILSREFKKIKIVTEYPEKFRKIDERTLENSGFSMIISKNKKQALTKTKIIINFDFSEETINQYNINENAIIINLSQELKINKKRFNGIIIKDYDIKGGYKIQAHKNQENNSNVNTNYDIEEIEIDEFYFKHIKESQIFDKALTDKKLEEANLSKFYIVRRIINEEDIQIKELYESKNKIF